MEAKEDRVTLADLAARRKALAVEFWRGHRRNFEFDYALVQAQRDLCGALRGQVNKLNPGYQDDDLSYGHAIENVLALLDRALDGEPPAPKE